MKPLAPVEPGTRVVVLGHNGLKDGARVRDVTAPALPDDPLTSAEKTSAPPRAGT